MPNWFSFFFEEIHKREIRELIKKVLLDYRSGVVFPPKKDVLRAFRLCEIDKLKAVVVGQDPYHEKGQADGLAFSSQSNKLPKSLQNIFKEYTSDLNYPYPKSGDLSKWAEQGVLLINSILTVKEGQALSCNYKEYEVLFKDIICFISENSPGCVFLLWGKKAQRIEPLIDKTKHRVIVSNHPSPLSAYRGFFNSHPFSKANEELINIDREKIDWRLD